MKTAEQYSNELVECRFDEMTSIVRQAMLEAYKLGCKDSSQVELGLNSKNHGSLCTCAICEYRKAIEILKDEKKPEDF